MALIRELMLHILTTTTLLAIFSWHEDNYYRRLLRKCVEMEEQEERFFHEIQQARLRKSRVPLYCKLRCALL